MSRRPFRGNQNWRNKGKIPASTCITQFQLDQDGEEGGRNRIRMEHRRFQPRSNTENYDHSRRKYHMGFKYIQNLLESDDLEDILVTLNNDKKGFKELLENSNITNDLIVLLIKLLSKICSSSFLESKIRLLQMAFDTGFVDNLTKFISTLAIQGMREKNSSKFFWNNTEEFWNNVINISQNVHDVIPMTSNEKTLKILTAMKVYLPVIQNSHKINISLAIIEKVENLHTVLEKASEELEKKSAKTEIIEATADFEPPDDFRGINIYPSVKEVTTRDTPFLRPNVIQGPYQNANHYLDVQFRLLREDFVAPLRRGICNYLNNTKERLEDVRIYYPIHFLKTETINEQNCYRIQFNFSKKKRNFQDENSRKFLFGSLLCFTSNNFQTIIFGKIVQRDIKDLEQGQLIIGFNEDVRLPLDLFEKNYLMVESKVYFEPYFHVLHELKKMEIESFPMERYIIRVETETNVPDYLLKIDPVFYEIEGHTFWPLNWNDSKKFYNLNEAQSMAFKAALTREFAIIQGPPGTGKTFLGLKIAHTLIRNSLAWYKKTPMLVICFTNHALDQFLEGLIPVTDDILRIGGQSKNKNVDKFNIRNQRYMKSETVIQMWHKVRSHLQKIADINETLNQIGLNSCILNFSVFSEAIPEYKNSWFSKASSEAIRKWLFGFNVYQYNIHQVQNNVNLNNTDMDMEEMDIDENELVDDVFGNIQCTFKPWITLKELYSRITSLRNELNFLQADNSMERLKKMFDEEELIYQLDISQRECRYLQQRLSEAANGVFRGKPDFTDLQNPNFIPPQSRWHLYFYWLEQYKIKLLQEREIVNRNFRRDYKLYNENREIQDVQIMKESLVIGMTTTAAARLKSSLQALKSPIVIVEEAAEVLEAHIITSLTSSCKHLILIGDHQQLKPSTANFTVETKYLLGISLFERMVNNNIQCHRLNVQHRMRPEIADLIRPAIYPVLEDHESVLNRDPILGLEQSVYFIDHQEPEQLCNDSSKKNIHEAAFLIKFAKHLVLNGHEPENITILATYLGQMFEMLRHKKNDALLQDVKVTVLDNYQGEENNIVLLSLVRSNSENKIGFLKIENRICVALSRAKCGFYMMGNMTQLCSNSDIWVRVKEILQNQNAFGPYLTLRCQIHRYKFTDVKTADDFLNIPEGGCNLLCEANLGCGHSCKSLCHVKDRDHTSYKCLEKCNRTLCNNEEHLCKKLCYETCGPCNYPVEYNLDCGHKVTIACHIDPAIYKCNVEVRSVLPCGHEVDKPCSAEPENFKCPEPCVVRVEPCGHACTRTCHINDDADHLQYRCRKPCARRKIDCSLRDDDSNVPDEEKHICSKFCFEECETCEVGVKKFRTGCPHVYVIACKENVDKIVCVKPCSKKLPCGHSCKNLCKDPCGNCRYQVEKEVPGCNHKTKLPCFKEADRKYCKGKCPRALPCGHKCEERCCDECTTFCKVIVDCTLPSPCGHVIKKIKCSLRNTDNKKILLQNCTEKCNTKLKCGHYCTGECGDCSQGRIHERCKEKCLNTLICNHQCPIPCSQACKPCEQKCNYKCRHSKCSKKCGAPCSMCREQCTRQCEHQKCKKSCGEICNIPPCYKPCKNKLNCGHPCVGFCGDPCPSFCRICNYDELTDIFLGNEDEPDARYVMLNDCKHIFESGDIETWLQSSGEIVAKFCPKCKTPISSTERFTEYIKRNMNDIINIKNKSYGTEQENNLRRLEMLDEIEQLQNEVVMLIENIPLYLALEKLKQRLQISKGKGKKRQRQNVNKIDMNVINVKLQIINLIMNVCCKEEKIVITTGNIADQLAFIFNALMRNENHITEQELQDVTLEIDRLSRMVQLKKVQDDPKFTYAKTKSDVKDKIQYIEKLLALPKRYQKEIDRTLQEELSVLNKLVASSVIITEVEKRDIVAAIGLQKGHWFKCPNGHFYCIDACGGAMQISKCIDCGVPVGGQSHQLLPDQRHAGEMDNSEFPAWSQAANLANYRF